MLNIQSETILFTFPKETLHLATRIMATLGILPEFDPKKQDWDVHLKRLQQFFIANEITDEEKKRAIVLNTLTEEAYKLTINLCIPKKPEDTEYNAIVNILSGHYSRKRAIFAERYRFYRLQKKVSETLEEWLLRVKEGAIYCDFENTLDMVLRDKFITGMDPGKVLDRLFLEDNKLTLARAVELAQNTDSAQIGYGLNKDISSVSIKEEPLPLHRFGGASARAPLRPNGKKDASARNKDCAGPSRPVVKNKSCHRCGKVNHTPDKCKYRQYVCNNCGNKGHLSNVCRNKQSINSLKPLNEVPMFAFKSFEPIMLQIKLNNVPLHVELDSGSAFSVMSYKVYITKFKNIKLKTNDIKLVSYVGNKIEPLGKITVSVRFQNEERCLDFYVIKNGGPPLVGRNFLHEFNVGFKNFNFLSNEIGNLQSKYKDVFSEKIGTFKTGRLEIRLKENAQPKCYKPRPVPYSLISKVDEELNRLVREGILTSVEVSEWATPIVPVLKPDKTVRICGDYKLTLNPNILVDKFPLPRIDYLFSKLKGGIKFTKLDLSHAYQQVLLSDNSRILTTISTHRGLFMYNRLPYGISSAPAQFQRIIHQTLGNIDGVCAFLDDILITGKSNEEHMQNLENVLNRLANVGLTVKNEKCSFFQNRVSYLGFIIDRNGLHKSPDKVDAIRRIGRPRNVKQLRSFIGSVNYYHRFIPNIPDILHPLYDLIKKDAIWNWNKKCQKSFDKIRDILSSTECLAHYDPEIELNLTVDASDYGLGAILSHVYESGEEKPIAFASRTLSEAEKKYSQLDKEATAIIFGVKKFYEYVYGRDFNLLCDHKPLISIFGPKGGIPQMRANRLQRYALFLAGFQYNLKYVKSERNTADFLSRLPLSNVEDCDSNDDVVNYLNYISENEHVPIDCNLVINESKKDSILRKVFKYAMKGWPQKLSDELKIYARHKDKINVQNKLLLLGERIIIPNALQVNLLNELHAAHMGIVKTKSLARSYLWWPTLNKDIETMCKSCVPCQTQRNSPPKTPLQNWPIPTSVWERIHIDFCGPLSGKYFLVVTDALSKWLDVSIMLNITAGSTIDHLRKLFATFGLPKVLVSDNGPQLVSTEFETFLKMNCIKHITTPPYSPASNGAAENSVKTVKSFLLKTMPNCKSFKELEQQLHIFLLHYRVTKHLATRETPAQLMFGRPLRTTFDLLKQTDTNQLDYVYNNINQEQKRNKKYYRGHRNIKFKIGQHVLVRDFRFKKPSWTEACIVKCLGINVYLVKTLNSNITYKRHANQIMDNSLENDLIKEIESINKDSADENVTNIPEGNQTSGEEGAGSEEPNSNSASATALAQSAPSTSDDRQPCRPARRRVPPNRLMYD